MNHQMLLRRETIQKITEQLNNHSVPYESIVETVRQDPVFTWATDEQVEEFLLKLFSGLLVELIRENDDG